MKKTIEQKVKEITSIYNKKGSEGYGEHVNQIQHALQGADIALKRGYDKEVIVAILLHDIGHLMECSITMGNLGSMNHEHMGADYLLSLGFSYRVSELVRNHVNTKRYLVARDENYQTNLSDASIGTLKYQGGQMTLMECDEYEKNEYFQDHLNIRNLDDLAKEKDIITNTWNFYESIIIDCLKN